LQHIRYGRRQEPVGLVMPNPPIVQKRLNQARHASKNKLDLSSCSLDRLPINLQPFLHVRSLNLAGNLLSELPDSLPELFPRLQELTLSINEFTMVPPVIKRMDFLTSLSLRQNRLERFSEDLLDLRKLKYLNLSRTGLQEIPSSIANLRCIERLILSENFISSLPSELGMLSSLRELNLSGNSLGPDMAPDLDFPSSLHSLDLGSNHLELLSPALGKLRDSLNLILEGNENLADPIPILIQRGTPHVLAYLRSLRDAVPQYEAKLLVVGEGNVGKTCLVEALRGGKFVKDRPTTHGIEIKSLRVPNPEFARRFDQPNAYEWYSHPSEYIDLRSWDFGGQEVYRISHQFFFSARALYLLVWRPREGQEENAVEGWIRRIRLRVGSEARILVVASHGAERQPELDVPSLMKKYNPTVVGAGVIDSETGMNISWLRDRLAHSASALPQMGEMISEKWLRVREDLRRLTTPYIDASMYNRICSEHGVPEGQRTACAGLLNDLGYLVHFPDDDGLSDLYVVQPEWLTKAIGYVLENKATRNNGGILDHEQLKRIWGAKKNTEYPQRLYPYFLRLMEKFDVSYRIPDENASLVAQLVPYEEPDLTWSDNVLSMPSLQLSCLLSDEAPGLIPWFTVRTHHFSAGRHWRGGTFLRHPRYGTEALLSMDGRTKVDLLVRGSSPNHFFQVLRDALVNLIERRWPGLTYEMVIPCPARVPPGVPCHGLFKLSTLDGYLDRQRTTITCPECITDHAVLKLAAGFDLRPTSVEDQLTTILAEVKAGAAAVEAQAEGLRRALRAIGEEVVDCPRLFVIRQAERRWNPTQVGKQRFLLTLWCEHSGSEHPVGEPYKFNQTRQWLLQVAPYVKWIARTMQLVAPLGAGIAGVIGGDEGWAKDTKADFQLMKALGDAAGPAIDNAEDDGARSRTLTAAEGWALRQFRELLFEIDPAKRFSGLRREYTETGDFLWVCDEHYSHYDPGLPTLP